MTASWHQIYAPQQVVEARVVAEGVPNGASTIKVTSSYTWDSRCIQTPLAVSFKELQPRQWGASQLVGTSISSNGANKET